VTQNAEQENEQRCECQGGPQAVGAVGIAIM
jgi:hypothetical protein